MVGLGNREEVGQMEANGTNPPQAGDRQRRQIRIHPALARASMERSCSPLFVGSIVEWSGGRKMLHTYVLVDIDVEVVVQEAK